MIAFGKPDLQCSLCMGAVSLQSSCVCEQTQHDSLAEGLWCGEGVSCDALSCARSLRSATAFHMVEQSYCNAS